MEKAYKLLALQEGISNRAAKELIDRGVVYSGGKKVSVARGEMSESSKFKIEKIAPIKVLFEDEFIMAVDKPAFMSSAGMYSPTSQAISSTVFSKLKTKGG